MIICSQCKGNGYVKVRFESEQAIEQCKVCDSQGEIDENITYIFSTTMPFDIQDPPRGLAFM